MDDDTTITMFHAGRFSKEAAPPWLLAIREGRCKGMDWNKATFAVLGCTTAHVTIGHEVFPIGEMRAYPTPGGGQYVELGEGETSFAEIWVAEAADWLPFNSAYIEPFLLTRATLHQADRTERLGNALIAYARHGDGRHADRDTGESRIDHREDWEREKRERAGQRTLIAAHGSQNA
jgi:hypothetical protein